MLSSRLTPYVEAYDGLIDSLATPAVAIGMDESAIVAIPRETRVIVTFGTRAALASYPEQAVRIHCMAPGAPIESSAQGRAVRIHLLSPPSKILATLRLLQPRLSRLGILQVLPTPKRFADEMKQAAEQQGVEVFVERMASAEDLPGYLRSLMRRDIDALWLPPDPLLINPHSIAVIREFSWSNDVPFYAPTGGLAESGACAAVAPSFRQIGRAAALEVRRVLSGEPVQEDVFPAQAEITVNAVSAQHAGLQLAPAAREAADRIISASESP